MKNKATLAPEYARECAALKALVAAHSAGKSRRDSLSQEEIGNRLGLSQGTVSSYLNGFRMLNLKFAVGMARLLSVELHQFSPRLARQHSEVESVLPYRPSSQVVEVLRVDLDSLVSNAVPNVVQPNRFEKISLSKDFCERLGWPAKAKHLYLIEAFSDCMTGSFQVGDTLVLDASVKAAYSDGVYLFELQGNLYLRRLQSDFGGGYLMGADNPRYLPIPIMRNQADHLHVIGKVVAACPMQML